jgi:hypothetical protein
VRRGRGRGLVVAGAVVLSAVALLGPARADTTYTTFTQGPSSRTGTDPSKDEFNNHETADPSTGQVTVLRANPTPGVLNCAGTGVFDYLRVTGAGPVSTVSVAYTQAVTTPFTFIDATIRLVNPDGSIGDYLGPEAKLRGPTANGSGALTIKLDVPITDGSGFVVDMGLITSSACPNVDGGTVTFTGVTAS